MPKPMDDKTFYKGCAHIADALLKNAANSFGIDFMVLNETLMELERRANIAGMTRKDLYPDTK